MLVRCVRTAIGVTALTAVVACGGSPHPNSAAPVAAAPAPQEVAVGPLEPVRAPPELFAVARLRNAAKLADVGVRWTSLPVDWRSLVARNLPGLERVLVLDAPIDVAATVDPSSVDPHVFWAFAFGASSADAAASYFLAQGNSVVRRGLGVYSVKLDSLSCQVAPARGDAPARVVCSDEMGSVDALAAYMTRGLPTETFGTSELHVALSAEPFQRRYSSQLSIIKTMGVPFLLRELELGHPKFDRALRDVVYDLADEVIALASDLGRVDIDASLSPREDAIDARMSISMIGQRSWTSQSVVRAAASNGAPPDFFWRLPEAATGASYGLYKDPEHTRGVAASLAGLLDGWLDYADLGDARRRPLVEAFQDLFMIGARSAYASLPMATPGRKAKDDPGDALRKLVGTHVFAVEQGGDRLQKFGSEVVKALGQRAFRDHLVKMKLLRSDQIPVARERAPKGRKGLPPGSKTYEFEFASAAFSPDVPTVGRPSKKDLAAHKLGGAPPAMANKPMASKTSLVVIVVPDGPMVWLGFGGDEAALVDALAEIRAGNGSTLALREGLGPLHAEKAISAGFTSLAATLPSLEDSLLSKSDVENGARVLGRLPHRGETPVLYDIVFDAVGPRMTVSTTLPQALVEDVVALTVSQVPLGR